MRLDLFLKVSRIALRRSLAQKLCDAGSVSVNGRPAKSSHDVKVGDELSITSRTKRLTIRVTNVPESRSVSKAAAATLYEVIKEEKMEE